MSNAAPIGSTERIQEIDIIRGFALFGVLWINLVTQSYTLAPAGTFDNLRTAPLDAVIEPVASVLVTGKAMALFSLLFGYGFAMIMRRLEARGADAKKVFIRRTSILFLIGLVHIWLVWIGDILHVYALMGLVLILTRNWSDRALLAVGLILALFSNAVVESMLQFLYEEPFSWWATYETGAERRFELLQGNSYVAYVAELWRASWEEMWGTPDFIPYCATTLGRFMVGAWVFRQGWLQEAASYRDRFRRWSVVLVSGGVALALLVAVLEQWSGAIAYIFEPVPQLVLALGYAATVVAVCKYEKIRASLRGIAAVGRTALSNYLMQSVMYIFVLYGFGLGFLNVLGATMCLAIAVLTFAAQIGLGSWWLSQFRFGPAEWLWRSLTYGRRQQFRLAAGSNS